MKELLHFIKDSSIFSLYFFLLLCFSLHIWYWQCRYSKNFFGNSLDMDFQLSIKYFVYQIILYKLKKIESPSFHITKNLMDIAIKWMAKYHYTIAFQFQSDTIFPYLFLNKSSNNKWGESLISSLLVIFLQYLLKSIFIFPKIRTKSLYHWNCWFIVLKKCSFVF